MKYDIDEYLAELVMKEADLKEEIEIAENELDNKKAALAWTKEEISWEKKKLTKNVNEKEIT